MKYNYITDEDKKSLENRLNIIEGQFRGIKQMIDNERDCDEILIQLSSISNALKSFGMTVLNFYIENKAMSDLKNGDRETIHKIIEMSSRVN